MRPRENWNNLTAYDEHLYSKYPHPYILERMSNVTTKAKLLENYGITTLFQETVGERIIKLGFK